MANSWESNKPSLSELLGGGTVAPTPVDVPTVSAKPSLSDITSEFDRTNHGFGDFSRTMDDGSTGFSLLPRGFMGGAHGGWANALDFFGADEWAQDHREMRDNEYAYNNGGLTVDDILEDDIGAWETVKRAGLFGAETSLRSLGEMTALGGAGARAKSVLGIAAGMSPFLANQWERMVDDRRANNGITEDGNVIDNFGEYAGQLPGALTVALSERLGLKAVGAGGPIRAGVTELGTEVGSEIVEDVSTKLGTLAQDQIDPINAGLGGLFGSLPQAGGQAALSGGLQAMRQSSESRYQTPFAPALYPQPPIPQGPPPPSAQGPQMDPMQDPSVQADVGTDMGNGLDPSQDPSVQADVAPGYNPELDGTGVDDLTAQLGAPVDVDPTAVDPNMPQEAVGGPVLSDMPEAVPGSEVGVDAPVGAPIEAEADMPIDAPVDGPIEVGNDNPIVATVDGIDFVQDPETQLLAPTDGAPVRYDGVSDVWYDENGFEIPNPYTAYEEALEAPADGPELFDPNVDEAPVEAESEWTPPPQATVTGPGRSDTKPAPEPEPEPKRTPKKKRSPKTNVKKVEGLVSELSELVSNQKTLKKDTPEFKEGLKNISQKRKQISSANKESSWTPPNQKEKPRTSEVYKNLGSSVTRYQSQRTGKQQPIPAKVLQRDDGIKGPKIYIQSAGPSGGPIKWSAKEATVLENTLQILLTYEGIGDKLPISIFRRHPGKRKDAGWLMYGGLSHTVDHKAIGMNLYIEDLVKAYETGQPTILPRTIAHEIGIHGIMRMGKDESLQEALGDLFKKTYKENKTEIDEWLAGDEGTFYRGKPNYVIAEEYLAWKLEEEVADIASGKSKTYSAQVKRYLRQVQAYLDTLLGKKYSIDQVAEMLIEAADRSIKDSKSPVDGKALWSKSKDGIFPSDASAKPKKRVPDAPGPMKDLAKGQSISSAKTSRKQVASLLKLESLFEDGNRNLDLGGGKFDLGTAQLKEYGVESKVMDEYNRTPEHNKKVEEWVGDGVDTVTVANVLNVIKEPEARAEVIQTAYDSLVDGGSAYFQVYYDSKKEAGETKDGYQNHKPLKDYLPEVQKIFPEAELKTVEGLRIIVAPKSNSVEISQADIKKLGLPVRDSKLGVGKRMGNDYYVHKSEASAIEKEFGKTKYDNAKKKIPSDFEYDLIHTNTKNGTIEFIQSPDWDTSNEPVRGVAYKVSKDGVKRVEPSKRTQIYHHKWSFVSDSYKGFDVQESMRRSISIGEALPELKEKDPKITSKYGYQDTWQTEVEPSLSETKASIGKDVDQIPFDAPKEVKVDHAKKYLEQQAKRYMDSLPKKRREALKDVDLWKVGEKWRDTYYMDPTITYAPFARWLNADIIARAKEVASEMEPKEAKEFMQEVRKRGYFGKTTQTKGIILAEAEGQIESVRTPKKDKDKPGLQFDTGPKDTGRTRNKLTEENKEWRKKWKGDAPMLSQEWFKRALTGKGKVSVLPLEARNFLSKSLLDINDYILKRTGIDLQDLSITGLGGLKDSKFYLELRYEMMGNMQRSQKMAEKIYNTFKDNRPHHENLMSFLKGEITLEQLEKVVPKDVFTTAKALREQINQNAKSLVRQGVLKPETVANNPHYLPRMYLKHVLGDSPNDANIQGGSARPSAQGYARNKKDIAKGVRDLMGEIVDPGYLGASTISAVGRDIAIVDFLNDIVKYGSTSGWIMPDSQVKIRLANKEGAISLESSLNDPTMEGKTVSIQWLLNEAENIGKRLEVMPDGKPKDNARAIKDQMEEVASKLNNKITKLHKDSPHKFKQYRQVPNSPKYGNMAGLYINKRIYNDLFGNGSISDSKVWKQAETIHGYWKLAKVPLNPPTIARNIMSNMVLQTLSGMSITDVAKYNRKAWGQVFGGEDRLIPGSGNQVKVEAKRGRAWEIAKKYGLEMQTFNNQEMAAINKEFREIAKEENVSISDIWQNPFMVSKALGRALGNTAGKFGENYQRVEVWQKLAVIEFHLDQGASDFDAFMAAQDALFDYSLLNHAAKKWRKAPIGSPFLSFTLLATRRFGQVAAQHPTRMVMWYAFTQIVWGASAFFNDVDDEDLRKLHKALPDYIAKKTSWALVPLPWRDADGRVSFLDLSYIHPFGAVWDMAKNVYGGEVADIERMFGMSAAPLVQFAIAMSSGNDPFTGRPITNEAYPTGKQNMDWIKYFWRQSSPSFLNEQGAPYKTLLAILDKNNKNSKIEYGAPGITTGQGFARFLGLNAYSVNPEMTALVNAQNMKYEMQSMISTYKRDIRNPNNSESERKELMTEFMLQYQLLNTEIMEMLELAKIHPNLKIRDTKK